MTGNKELISVNPSTEEELERVTALRTEDIDKIVEKAGKAQINWRTVPLKKRLECLDRVGEIIYRQSEDIARIIASEQGKTLTEAQSAEVLAVLASLKGIKKRDVKVLKERRIRHGMILFSHKKTRHIFVPYGVVGVISAWNYPFSVPLIQILYALAAGNTVIFKPAPSVIRISQKIDALFEQAGFPEGAVNTVFVHDDEAPYLAGHKGMDKLVFTGSTETGKKVMQTAAEKITPVVLELGGKDPAVVAADADLERTAKGVVWGAMFNSGQVCSSIERVYVERKAAEKFIRLCIRETEKLKIGNPLDPDTDIGPLSSREQMDFVRDHIEDAQSKGAQLLTGGRRLEGKGFFLKPAVLARVDHSMKIMNEETFGPVLPIMEVDSMDQAVELANDSPYGLSAFGWTTSRKTAEKLERELEAGTVMINDATSSWGEPNAPWGGFKQSGIGRTHSQYGMQEMVQVKYVSYDRGCNSKNLWWFPYDAEMNRIMKDSVRLLFSRKIGEKFGSFLKLIKNKRFTENIMWKSVLMNLRKLF